MALYVECFHSSKTITTTIWWVQIVDHCRISPPNSKASAGEMGPQAASIPGG